LVHPFQQLMVAGPVFSVMSDCHLGTLLWLLS
jgi:hypothetical protein